MKSLYLLSFFLSLAFLSCSKKVSVKSTENPDYDKAFEYREAQKPDSAFLYFNKAKERFLQAKDSLGAGKCLVNMAIISTDKGDFFGGQEISLSALAYFDGDKESNQVYLKSDYNNLGITSYNLTDYAQAIRFYQQALKFTTDTNEVLIVENNIANAYRHAGAYKQSIAIYKRILTKSISKVEYARTLANFSYTKWLENKKYNALPDLRKALGIRMQENDLKGQNTNYAQLADYYESSNIDSSFHYARKMYFAAKAIANPVDELEALQKIIKVSPAGNYKSYFSSYKRLNDSIQLANNASKNQFALIRYESEKHKGDNLVLQKKNSEKTYQIFMLISAIILLSAGGTILHRKRKQHIELTAENSIRDNQLETSKKVHDVVANGLYRVMMTIANQKQVDKEEVLDKIEILYNKSRNISYEAQPFDGTNFHGRISELLRAFASQQTKVLIIGNSEELWAQCSNKIKYELEHILQELMVNMEKHSEANSVVVRFEQLNREIKIHYQDDGLGFSNENKFKNGLNNTGNRIKSIKGVINFESDGNKGLRVFISFPF